MKQMERAIYVTTGRTTQPMQLSRSHLVRPILKTVRINKYSLRQYISGCGLSAHEATTSEGFQICRTKFLATLMEGRDEKNSIIFYRGQVHSEMMKTLSYCHYTYRCPSWHPGNLVQSKFVCVAGDDPGVVCKHVAGVCYAIAHFNETGKWLIRETVTQKKQTWHAPKSGKRYAPRIGKRKILGNFSRFRFSDEGRKREYC